MFNVFTTKIIINYNEGYGRKIWEVIGGFTALMMVTVLWV